MIMYDRMKNAMSIICDPQENQMLCALWQAEFEHLASHLELVTLSRSEVLFEANDELQHVYFPVTATHTIGDILWNSSCVAGYC